MGQLMGEDDEIRYKNYVGGWVFGRILHAFDGSRSRTCFGEKNLG